MSGFAPEPGAPGADPALAARQRERIGRALRMVTVPFPYLAGLAAAARVDMDTRLPTMGVFASGRMVANPAFCARLNDTDLRFVVAHELLHLALRTHQRALGSDRMQFNIAHDYIINDVLRAELGVSHVPAGGLDMPGARHRSAEAILLDLQQAARAAQASGQGASRVRVWRAGAGAAGSARGAAGAAGDPTAGGSADEGHEGNEGDDGDVLADGLEREWYGDERDAQRDAQRRTEAAARRGAELARARGNARGALATLMGLAPGAMSADVEARRGRWRTPSFLALQRWIEAVTLGPRTYERPARRSAADPDVVLAGRRRHGWALNVVLDTSGSMTDELPYVLGAIGECCDTLGVDQVRLVQCDAAVTADDWVEPAALARRRIDGFGGSDLSPAFAYLAADHDVRAVVAITDGDILYPDAAPPYEVLWLVPAPHDAGFVPRWGRVLALQPRGA
jgi:predicted metal-dependent peptidase